MEKYAAASARSTRYACGSGGPERVVRLKWFKKGGLGAWGSPDGYQEHVTDIKKISKMRQ